MSLQGLVHGADDAFRSEAPDSPRIAGSSPQQGSSQPCVQRADLHCHVDFSRDPVSFARAAERSGILQYACTVTPGGYDRARRLFDEHAFPLLRIGVGLHPWWVSENEAQARLEAQEACARITTADFVGEVGLDFSARHVGTAVQQRATFRLIIEACAQMGGRVISIHAVRSAAAVLDILEKTGAVHTCRCVLHWFSGTSDDLTRARRMGCWFSVGERMLATKRGRAYVSQMPVERLLVETDLPARMDDPLTFDEYRTSLDSAYEQLASLRGPAVAHAAVTNAVRLCRG